MIIKYIVLLFIAFNLYAQDTLGRIDKFDMPKLNIYNVTAKIDTGAKTSSINCDDITPVGHNQVSFVVLDANNKRLTDGYVTKDISRISKVKSSNGVVQTRYFINTKIIIYGKSYNMEVSLSSRKEMLYPLLIGRELLNKGFIIDVTKEFLSYNEKRKTQE
ncbi:ATP-dependent zinc protease [Sulfurimonas sp. CS5]|uniref:ATP-dependent zinc protease family protein n=1 Tax=Sulfurimonas sp. CS5 TaxID=3391145 RepID=UPI0039E9382C